MTEEEVMLIYDYLHENFKYENGDFIITGEIKGKTKGHRLGGFVEKPGDKQASFKATLRIGNMRKTFKISSLVWIFHHKEHQKYISHLDNNIVNTKIENLIKNTAKVCQSTREWKVGIYKTKGNGYCAAIRSTGGHMGVYASEEIAKEVYAFARDLYFNKHLNIEDIKKITKTLYHYYETDNNREEKGWAFVKGGYQVYVKRKYIGFYKTPEEAHAAYLKAKEEYAKNA